MKKILSYFVLVTIISATNFSAFSQKIRSRENNKIRQIKPVNKTDVTLGATEALTDGNGVYLRWQTTSETRNLGFFVYRNGANGSELVSPAMIAGAATRSSDETSYGENYTFYDARGTASDSYYIVSFSTNGQKTTLNQIFPRFVNSLKEVANVSSQELAESSPKENQAIESQQLKIPSELKLQVAANSLPADLATQAWVAAQPGVKIGVAQEGFYRVSRAQLQSTGFDVNQPGNLWQLYVDGKQQAINVGANDSYIEFYGKGMNTRESGTKYYFLVAGTENGKRIEQRVMRSIAGTVVNNSYAQSMTNEYRTIYLSSDVLNGEQENFFHSVPIFGAATAPTAVSIPFTLTGVDFDSKNASFEVGVQGITFNSHQISVIVNGENIGSLSGSGKTLMKSSFRISPSTLREGANTLELAALGGSGDIDLADSIKVSYSRQYKALQNRVSFYTANYKKSVLSGFTSSNIRVFDLTYEDSPVLYNNLKISEDNGNFSVNLPAYRSRVMYGVEDSGLLSPVSIAVNTPSTLTTAAYNADLIIVSYKGFLPQAEDWATYRRNDGMKVEVVDVEDIFDELSYGSLSTAAMTQFFKFAKENWQTSPKYIMLLGDAVYDYRNYENRTFQNFVPTKLVDTIYEETGSDESLCDFDNDGLADISVGRVPAKSSADATQLLNRVKTFEANLSTAYSRGAIFASDLPNGYDFEGLSSRIAGQLPTDIPRIFINRGIVDSKNVLLSEINKGRYIINYSGHGSGGSWDGNFFLNSDVPTITNGTNYSLFFALTCLNGYFIRPDVDSLSESMLRAPGGGAVASWASTGKTTPDVQEVMAARFYDQLNVGNMNRIGALVTDAKQSVQGGQDVRLSWALLGDPTLKIKP